MVANRKLKAELQSRLGISIPVLYKRAEEIRDTLDMEVDHSIYLLALKSGLRLKRYLDSEEVKRIRELQVQYDTLKKMPQQTPKPPAAKATNAKKTHIIRMPAGVEIDDPLLPDRIIQDAKRMAGVYPWFYYLENSIRSFICAAKEKYEGSDWWKHVNPKLHDKVNGRKNVENKNRWHQTRGDRDIDYLDFMDLKGLINGKTRSGLVKSGVLPNGYWFETLMDEVYASRCVIAHMNPLTADNVDGIELWVKKWNKQIKAKYKDLVC